MRGRASPRDIAIACGGLLAVSLFIAAVAWCNIAWERWKAGIYAEEFQRRGMAPQAVPK